MNAHYRPDIDGLRAVSILAVLFYHVWPASFAGGFLGVDVFFVISGYLITAILLRDNHLLRFSFLEFYRRRILRLFPALLLMLTATVIAGYLWLLPVEFDSLNRLADAGLLFFSNFTLMRESGYFDVASVTKPLLHLWSLAVEEQFYVFWPLLVWFSYKQGRDKHIAASITLVTVISLGLFIFWSLNSPHKAFYHPLSRFWEMGAGALIACVESRRQNWFAKCSDTSKSLLSPICIATMMTCFVVSGHNASLNIWTTILTVFATSVFISVGQSTRFNTSVMGHRTLVFIGLVSYPLYLWHWPIVSLYRINTEHEPTPSAGLILIALSFALAIATYLLVEQKLIHKKRTHAKHLTLMLATYAVGLALFCKVARTHVLPVSAQSEAIQQVNGAIGDWAYPSVAPSTDLPENEIAILTLQGDLKEKTLFIGDSNMEQYYPRIKEAVLQPHSKSAVFITGSGCIPTPKVQITAYPYCHTVLKVIEKTSKDPSITSVVIAAQWMGYFYTNGNHTLDGESILIEQNPGVFAKTMNIFEDFIVRLKAPNDKSIYLVLNIPVGPEFEPTHLLERSWKIGGFKQRSTGFSRAPFESKMAPIKKTFVGIANRTRAIVIDPLEFLCERENCATHDAGGPLYKDGYHLRPHVAKRIRYLDQTLR